VKTPGFAAVVAVALCGEVALCAGCASLFGVDGDYGVVDAGDADAGDAGAGDAGRASVAGDARRSDAAGNINITCTAGETRYLCAAGGAGDASDSRDTGAANGVGDTGAPSNASNASDASNANNVGASDASIAGGATGASGSATGGAEAFPSHTGIRCGTSSCNPDNRACCVDGAGSLSCVPSHGQGSCKQGTEIRCDDSSQCGGGVCCIHVGLLNTFLGTTCAPSCPSETGSAWLEVCNPARPDCDHCLALGVELSPPFTSTWFYACQ
jgi:hypothetical protein